MDGAIYMAGLLLKNCVPIFFEKVSGSLLSYYLVIRTIHSWGSLFLFQNFCSVGKYVSEGFFSSVPSWIINTWCLHSRLRANVALTEQGVLCLHTLRHHFPCVVHLKSLASRSTVMCAIRQAIAGKDPVSSVGSLVSFQWDREPYLCEVYWNKRWND